STRTLDRAHNSDLLKIVLYIPGNLALLIYILPRIADFGKLLDEYLGSWGWLIACILWVIAILLSHAILAIFDVKASEIAKRNPRGFLFFICLAITFSTAFLIMWCVWILVQLTAGFAI